ncbi:unnamed protein product [Thlaspi arvense]|uniref:Uncharacterized protein n=1 Tax=Thlaspi arvense TaxID=13288 RepID=A0AAU9RIA8_THLAR|nr:unnamed protein product [Thlaspi arvense]
MENSASESRRSLTRLQRQAPTALHLDGVSENPFLQQSRDAVSTAAIPLLSPLFVSPNPHSSLPREGDDSKFPANGTQPSTDHKEGCQYSVKADHSNQMALLNMFQTKLLLVNHQR